MLSPSLPHFVTDRRPEGSTITHYTILRCCVFGQPTRRRDTNRFTLPTARITEATRKSNSPIGSAGLLRASFLFGIFRVLWSFVCSAHCRNQFRGRTALAHSMAPVGSGTGEGWIEQPADNLQLTGCGMY